MTRVLVATGDVLETRMAGPAIRAWEMAGALAREHEVRLVTTEGCNLSSPTFSVEHVDAPAFASAIDWCEVVIFQGNLMALYDELRTTDRIVVADIYDPFHLEVLEQARARPWAERVGADASTTATLNQQLARGDFFLCASAKQRDFWLGQLAGVGRLNPATYDDSANLDTLIAVVPFGVPHDPPQRTRAALKGVVTGIAADDQVILWGGGIYNWFDPVTLIHAVDRLRVQMPKVRLFFLGLRHPNPHVPEMAMSVRAVQVAEELGLRGTHVFFNDDWVAYDDRQNYLLDADVGVSTHLDHVETAFSFRTRILDYLWAGLPVVTTGGDALADLVEAAGAGVAVPAGDVDALHEALGRVLGDPVFAAACRGGSATLAYGFRWETALEPLLAFCRNPRRAPDRDEVRVGDPIGADPPPASASSGLRLAMHQARAREWRTLSHRAQNLIRRTLRSN